MFTSGFLQRYTTSILPIFHIYLRTRLHILLSYILNAVSSLYILLVVYLLYDVFLTNHQPTNSLGFVLVALQSKHIPEMLFPGWPTPFSRNRRSVKNRKTLVNRRQPPGILIPRASWADRTHTQFVRKIPWTSSNGRKNMLDSTLRQEVEGFFCVSRGGQKINYELGFLSWVFLKGTRSLTWHVETIENQYISGSLLIWLIWC